MGLNLLIAGDVVPRRRTIDLFHRECCEDLFPGFKSLLSKSDYNIVNFESPIVRKEGATTITKSGGHLRTNIQTLKVLKSIGFNAVTLANNHFRDYGQTGVNDTIESCRELNVDYVGGGIDKAEANRPLFVNIGNKKLCIINVCENEFSIASDEYGGSNGIDLIQMYNDIQQAKLEADHIIVITHGGKEHYQLPTPRMKKWYRHFIDLGADAVVNHHQHCFSGYEVYRTKPIFYGLGNFNFETKTQQKSYGIWNKGFCVRLILDDQVTFDLIPYTQCAEKPSTILVEEDSDFVKTIDRLNTIIQDEKLLQESFDKYCEDNQYEILSGLWFYGGKVLKKIYRMGLLGRLYNRKNMVNVFNRLNCESHNDSISNIVKNIAKI